MTLVHPQFEGDRAGFAGRDDCGSWKVGQILTIGEIVNHKGESVDSLMLEPQGIAHLVSNECVHLPPDVCGLAHVLTRLCNDGLLTLNIGVIDPGWKNRLSTPILNFSSEKRLLQKDDKFIRLTFHRIHFEAGANMPECSHRSANMSEGEYGRGVRARSVANFGKNFLNIKRLVGQASKKENDRLRETMLKYLPIAAFSLAFFALLVTIGVATAARFAADSRDAEVRERLEKLEKIQNDYAPMRRQPSQSPAMRQEPAKIGAAQPKRAP